MKLSTSELSKIEFIDFHTHRKNFLPETLSVLSIELADLQNLALDNLDHKFFSVGLHPWRLPSTMDNILQDCKTLGKALQLPKVIAIGEIGLDALRGPDMKIQKAYFAENIKLARKLNKTLIIHCVRSYPELISIRKQFAPDLNMLVHGFNSKVKILEQLLEHDFYVSFGSISLKRDDICEYIRQNPECFNRICLETDDSGINIEDIYKRAAKVFEFDIQELKQIMKTNFISLFRDSDSV
ncbi:MAG: TatD family hydrolase [Victivallales bacterium]|nr:TatD family hydrolase [Victivallales bacterium]